MQDKNNSLERKNYRLWKQLLISHYQKEAIKRILFSSMPFLFNKLAAYQDWNKAKVFTAQREGNPCLQHILKEQLSPKVKKLALVFHVFHLDILKELLSVLLEQKNTKFNLFITCPENLYDEINIMLTNKKLAFQIMITENHGRDILPFLKILPEVLKQDFDIILKIHTKRDNHRNKKNLWSTELFGKLLGEENMQNALQIFSNYPKVGMIGPAGHILPMSMYYGGNAKIVQSLSIKMGVKKEQLSGMNFVAGSMFYATKDALEPILKLGLKDADFESEDKQLDKTMAHSIERIFAAGLIVTDKILVDTNSTPEKLSCKLTLNHPFTI
jgi:lipopolysaccharide biosynthesis protein